MRTPQENIKLKTTDKEAITEALKYYRSKNAISEALGFYSCSSLIHYENNNTMPYHKRQTLARMIKYLKKHIGSGVR